jgi:hypothetical protein
MSVTWDRDAVAVKLDGRPQFLMYADEARELLNQLRKVLGNE